MMVKHMNCYERLRLCRVNTRRAYKNFHKNYFLNYEKKVASNIAPFGGNLASLMVILISSNGYKTFK